jgi:[lysine-biosynthesis-protein LysW]--L-2-aminoadipate ligase
MMEDKHHGLVVHEVNNTVEFRGAASVSNVDIPSEMIDYAVKLARK